MIKQLIIVLVLLSLNQSYGMGEPPKDIIENAINNTDPWHEIYEVVPLSIEDFKLKSLIFPMENEKILVYQHIKEFGQKNDYKMESMGVYDIRQGKMSYVFKNKEINSAPYQGLLLPNKKIIIMRAENGMPGNGREIEIFNPETESIEYSMVVTRSYSIRGLLNDNEILLYSGYGIFKYIISKQQIEPYEHSFLRKKNKWGIPFEYKGDLYFYQQDKNTREATQKYNDAHINSPTVDKSILNNRLIKDYLNIYKYHPKDDTYELVMPMILTQWGADEIMISEDKMLMFGGFTGATRSLRRVEEVDFKTETQQVLEEKITVERDPDNVALLDDGNVLIMHGKGKHSYNTTNALDTLELYVVSENRFVVFKTGMKRALTSQYVRLSNGDILIYGGLSTKEYDKNRPIPWEAEIFRKKHKK
jgi:hypothetical protein